MKWTQPADFSPEPVAKLRALPKVPQAAAQFDTEAKVPQAAAQLPGNAISPQLVAKFAPVPKVLGVPFSVVVSAKDV